MNYTCWNFKCICLYIILDDRYVSTSYTSVQNTGWPPSKSPGICTRSLTRRGLGTCRALVGWDEPMVSSGGPVENWGDVGGVPIIRILGCIDNPSSSTSCEWRSRSKLFDLFPIGSMGLVYLPTFIPVIYHKKIQRKSVGTYTSPMDPMGLNESWIHDLFASVSFIEVHWITSQSIRWFHPLRPTSFPSTRWSPPVPMHRSPWRKHPKNNGKSWSKMWNCETFVRLHQKPSRTNMGPHGLVVFLVAWSTSCCSCRRRTSLKVVHFLAMLWWQRAEDFLPGVVWTCTGKTTLDIIHVNSWESWDHMILFFFSEKRYPNPNWEHLLNMFPYLCQVIQVHRNPTTLAMINFRHWGRCRRWGKWSWDVWCLAKKWEGNVKENQHVMLISLMEELIYIYILCYIL